MCICFFSFLFFFFLFFFFFFLFFSSGHLSGIILPDQKCFPEMCQHFMQGLSHQITSCFSPFPLGPRRQGCGSRAECWDNPRHLPSEQGIEDAPLCITFALRSELLDFWSQARLSFWGTAHIQTSHIRIYLVLFQWAYCLAKVAQ